MRPIFAVACIIALPFVVIADEPSAANLLKEGQRLLENGDTVESGEVLRQAANLAMQGGDHEIAKRAYFFLARIEQDVPRARSYYERALKLDPRFAAAANNLADLLERTYGEAELPRVHDLYATAVANGGKLEPFYLANYARSTAKVNPEKAASMYRRVLELQPDDVKAEEELLRLVPSSELLTYVRKLVDAGSYDRAQKLVIEHLHRPIDAKTKRPLLAIVATTLAKQHVTRKAFENGGAARALSTIDDASVVEGIKDLFRLYAAERAGYDWWKRHDPSALSLLARELADQARTTGEKKKAQWYQMFALDVTGGRDPEAFLALTDYYYRNGNKAALEELVQKYGDDMFGEKNALYEDRGRNLDRIYQYHVALGTIFSRLGWTSENRGASSAIFQLERARVTAADYNRSRGSKQAIVVDPNVIDLLAASYKKEMPESGRDIQLRIEAAEDYVGQGRTSSAARVIRPVAADPRLTPGNEKVLYDKVIDKLPSKGVKLQTMHIPRVSLEREAAKKIGAARAKDLESILQAMQSASADEREALDRRLKEMGVVYHGVGTGDGKVQFRDGAREVIVRYTFR